MIYSSSCGHAIRALARLTLLQEQGYVLVAEICEGTDLPRYFVAKIFQTLARHGLLVSAKGRGGGFALARPPSKITLYEVVAVIDGQGQFDKCVAGMAACDDKQPCPQHEDFKPIRSEIKRYLKRTTLRHMADATAEKLERIGAGQPEKTRSSKPVRGRK